jgi:hypothetical protein
LIILLRALRVFVFSSCDILMGMVVNPYLFGMTNPHERNRYCSNNRAKDELVHWPSIFEKSYPGSKRVQPYKFTGRAISNSQP